MMQREATWLGEHLLILGAEDLGPVLSVGSGHAAFRRRFQPWIDGSLFDPLEQNGVRVLHHELEAAEGIDVAGDLGSPAVIAQLRDLGVRTILCLNVLEHVENPGQVVASLESAIPIGGRIVLTVPCRFPYHPDPIDTMYRPEPSGLAALFSRSMSVESGTITCESLMVHWLKKPGKWAAIKKGLRGLRRSPTAARKVSATEEAAPSTYSAKETLRMALVSTELTYAIASKA
jgi:hypothetical protein